MAFLNGRPADSRTITTEILGIPRAPDVVSERLTHALLGADPRVGRLADGRWALIGNGGRSPKLRECTYAVVDVETTGSRARGGDRITEIAVVLLHQGGVEVALDTLVNPERPIPNVVTALTRITAADVRDKPVFADIADEVLSVLSGRIFVAHNVRFDWSFVQQGIRRARNVALSGPQLCTVRLAKRLIPGLKSRSLDSVAEYFGIENSARHRAGGDAMATAQLLSRLLDRAEDQGVTTVAELQRFSRRGKKKKRKRLTERSLPSLLDEI